MFVTAVCLLCLFKLNWPKNKNFYDTLDSDLKFNTPSDRIKSDLVLSPFASHSMQYQSLWLPMRYN